MWTGRTNPEKRERERERERVEMHFRFDMKDMFNDMTLAFSQLFKIEAKLLLIMLS